jgi:aryl-alcohol dehydrogenase-like predicted oxidoreductase
MYGEGDAEEVVADAIEGQRDCVFIVTKSLSAPRVANGVAQGLRPQA